MFNKDSAQPEKPAGGSELSHVGPTVLDQANTEETPEPSVESTTGGLPPWIAAKYEFQQSAAGNKYLTAQEGYVDDVLHYGEQYITKAVKAVIDSKKDSDERNQVAAAVKELTALHHTLSAFDGEDGTEANALNRLITARLVLAYKISGSSHADNLEEGRRKILQGVKKEDISDNTYFKNRVSAREKWARNGAFWVQIGMEILPADMDLEETIRKGVRFQLRQDAFDYFRNLNNPRPSPADEGVVDAAELAALCA